MPHEIILLFCFVFRNKHFLEGKSFSLFFSARATIGALVKEAGILNLGCIRNSIGDFVIIRRLSFKDLFPKSEIIKEVYWNLPPPGWIK